MSQYSHKIDFTRASRPPKSSADRLFVQPHNKSNTETPHYWLIVRESYISPHKLPAMRTDIPCYDVIMILKIISA